MAQKNSYLESLMLDEDAQKIAKYKNDYDLASAAGDAAGMAEAHAGAEKVREKYGFSGGTDGSADIQPDSFGIVGRYDSALKGETATLKAGIDSDLAEIDRQREEIPIIYRDEQNRLAGVNASQTRSVNEVAVASGLNSGTRTQQSIAMSNIYQANSAKLGRELAARLSELEDNRLKLIIDYRAAVAQAIARNESEKAAALYDEYLQKQKEQEQAQKEYEQALRQEEKENQQALEKQQKEKAATAKTQVDAMLKIGVEPPAELLELTGYSREYVDAMIKHYEESQQPRSYSSGGGYSASSGTKTEDADSIIGSDAWYTELYNTYGANAENMLRYHYGELGLKSGNVNAAVDGYVRWLAAKNAVYTPSFSDIRRTCQGLLQTGNLTKAKQTAQGYFAGLTGNQKTDLSALFTRYGVEL